MAATKTRKSYVIFFIGSQEIDSYAIAGTLWSEMTEAKKHIAAKYGCPVSAVKAKGVVR